MRPTPSVDLRIFAIWPNTFLPGSSPPSPGLAPCAILIWISSEFARYSEVTPKRPEATCLIALRFLSPLGPRYVKRSGSSPPSPVLLLPPSWFMAIARVSCASFEMEPKLIAPLTKRFTISFAGSTSSRERGLGVSRNSRRPRSVHLLACSLACSAKAKYFSRSPLRPVSWMPTMVLGSLKCDSPPLRKWNSPALCNKVAVGRASGTARGQARSCMIALSRSMVSSVIPPMREAVPAKHRAINSAPTPTASKICAPL
mmetsp:Transcript_3707/g.6502  ORF Transcript_3707/g.6502 Transcript_3707/m.6502 type:complete len:257 (+) Transcript_3707:858-1628(+)